MAATHVGRQYGVVRAAAAVEHRLVGGSAEVGRVVVRGAGGAAASDVVQIDLVGRAVDVLGAVDRAAVPRRVATRAEQARYRVYRRSAAGSDRQIDR